MYCGMDRVFLGVSSGGIAMMWYDIAVVVLIVGYCAYIIFGKKKGGCCGNCSECRGCNSK